MSLKNLFSIEGKLALVTGGSRGIGEMITAGFLANGARVYISSRKADVCDATAERLSAEYGGQCISAPADCSNLDGVGALAAAVAERESQLDVLVNNAGVSWGAPPDEFPEIGWDAVGSGNPSGRVGSAEDIAGVAIFLSSRAGAYTVGDTIVCDGGAVAAS
ncbi:MAG: SDR family oxidoreductase [Pseudomonadales bacterium]|jgi:2-deoxy-D-gluconate 3-dehydrogenase|nr:SDR family oxidoreductase [Pseudomonadales bacterium]MDP6470419.1 SDR family oxidoreductase [Pseudomonadales bacterium]MDP6827719.1 SDR family oxidoreductase [Pseudomonadales bacterium]MDP6973364.1 SDR family oxidoreductase [Pseudomonadales bacterium]|tara:strand:- start:641 stop:1126 length:486 start_codon:yes stop_codon:yes gene_type:complete